MKKNNTIKLKVWWLSIMMPLWSIMKHFDWKSLNTEGTKKEIIAEIKKWIYNYRVAKKDKETYKDPIS